MIRLLVIFSLFTALAGAQCTKWLPSPHVATSWDCVSTAPGGLSPGCKTYTVTSTDAAFIAASTSATVTLTTLPAGAIIVGVYVKHSAQFSDGGGAMTQVNVSIGSAGGGATFYTSTTNIGEATAVAATTLQVTSLFKIYTTAAEAVNAVFTATGANFGNGSVTALTGGSVTIKVCYVVP